MMNDNLKLFKEREKQALDINSSVWISASAGGGKTTIIIKRVLKLLLLNIFNPQMFHVEHSKIVILTYTNEAANEIKKRIRNRLYEWSIDVQKLEDDISFFEISANVPRGTFYNECIKNAEKLFEQNIHSKIIIKSFHSFCADLVYKYQSESNLGNNPISITNEQQSEQLISETINSHLIKNRIRKFSQQIIKDGIEEIKRNLNCSTWNISEIQQNTKNFLEIPDNISRDSLILDFLHKEEEQILHHINSSKNQILDEKIEINSDFQNCSTWNNYSIALFKKHHSKELDKILPILSDTENKNLLDLLKKYMEIFVTKDDNIRKIFEKSQEDLKLFHVEQSDTQHSFTILDIVKSKLCEIKAILFQATDIEILSDSIELLRIVTDILSIYNRKKRQNNLIDFDDIINQVDYLLEKSDHRNWILYQLNNQIQHLIVDESQDNSEKQWNFIRNITENILHSTEHSTLFIVGDIKQSIYSFHGANPSLFNEMRNCFTKKFEENRKKLINIEWNFSFRIPKKTLRYIDNFFNENNLSDNLTLERGSTVCHISLSEKEGDVETIPYQKTNNRGNQKSLYEVPKKPRLTNCSTWNNFRIKITMWKNIKAKFYKCSTWNISNSIENQILSIVKKEIKNGTKPNEIMILFRSRNTLMQNLIKLFYVEHLNIYGNFKQDILNNPTNQFISLLTTIIYSNVEQTINLPIPLKHERNILLLNSEFLRNFKVNFIHWKKIRAKFHKCSTWNNLQMQHPKIIRYFTQYVSNKTNFKNLIYNLMLLSKHLSYSRVLDIIHKVYCKILDHNIISEIKNTSNMLSSYNLNSRTSFILHFKNKENQIIKQQTSTKNGIRILTIHGAKGLEADVVIVIDDILKKSYYKRIYYDKQKKIFLISKKPYTDKILIVKNESEKLDYQESCRLLYVALTRTKGKLIIFEKGNTEQNTSTK